MDLTFYVVLPGLLFFFWCIFSTGSGGSGAAPRKSVSRAAQLRTALYDYEFPLMVVDVFTKENPHLSAGQRDLAFRGLREYFMLMLIEHQMGRQKPLGMPSELVDEAWHAFVLCTLEYELFCKRFFGRMVHHQPDPSARPGLVDPNAEFKSDTCNTWAAYRNSVRRYPAYFTSVSDMPLLFGLDSYVGLTSGWLWTAPAVAALERQAPLVAESADSAGGSCTSFESVGTLTGSSGERGSGSHHSHSAPTDSSAHGGHGGDSCSDGHSCGGHCGGGSSCGSSCGGGGD
ncbi:hypothetical protein G3A43_07695 [Paraburkholderia aspalathi]|nr:hypothetical protein [Paraburkholderia aspalathi]MBK3780138.1 hypothetical protein [Paraburkholderia aspalathi]